MFFSKQHAASDLFCRLLNNSVFINNSVNIILNYDHKRQERKRKGGIEIKNSA